MNRLKNAYASLSNHIKRCNELPRHISVALTRTIPAIEDINLLAYGCFEDERFFWGSTA